MTRRLNALGPDIDPVDMKNLISGIGPPFIFSMTFGTSGPWIW